MNYRVKTKIEVGIRGYFAHHVGVRNGVWQTSQYISYDQIVWC